MSWQQSPEAPKLKALLAKDKMPNKTQTKERIREGKEKATLFQVSLQTPGKKKKGREVEGESSFQ